MNRTIGSWLFMPLQPRSTVKNLIEVPSLYGNFFLTTFYAIQAIFYAANYWSLGLFFPLQAIFFGTLIAAPFLGRIWLFLMGAIFHTTGKWFGGQAKRSHLRTIVACSKIPFLIFLLFWFVFIYINPQGVFILGQGDPSPLLLTGLSFVLGAWSQALCIQSLREIQGFSFFKALINTCLAWVIYALSFFFLFFVARFIFTLN